MKRYECLLLNKCDFSVQDWEHLALDDTDCYRGEIRRPTIHGLLPLGVHTGALLLTRGRGIYIYFMQILGTNEAKKLQDLI